MPVQPVARQSVTDLVVAQLVDQIVAGDLAPGEVLPAERQLAEAFGVSRPAVREGLQRLAQSRLIDVRQGDGTTVRDFRSSAGPELLPHLLVRQGTLDVAVARSIIEVRAILGPDAAALAALRAPVGTADGLDDLVDRLATADGPVARQRTALTFWDVVVDATDNLALRLLFNTMRAAYEPAMEALAHVLAAEVAEVDRYRAIVDAIRDGDGDGARTQARDLLAIGTDAVLAALAALAAEAPAAG